VVAPVRGVAQVSIGDAANGPFTDLGRPLDFYAASAIYTNLATLRVTNSAAGAKYLKFTVTGKNPSSSGYQVVLDTFTFVRVSDRNASSALEGWRMGYFGTAEKFMDLAKAFKTLDQVTPPKGTKVQWQQNHDGLINAAFRGIGACGAGDDAGIKAAIGELIRYRNEGHKIFK